MTAQVPIPARPLNLASDASIGIASALDRIAYFFLCGFMFDFTWGESMPALGRLLLVTGMGLAAFGTATLRTVIIGRIRKPCPLHYWMLGFVAWSTLSIFWTADLDSTLNRVDTYLQLLTVVWLVWELAVSEVRVLGLIQAYVLGALVSSILTIYNFMIGRTAAQLAAAYGLSEWETSRYSIAGVNSNDLGLIVALSIPMIFFVLASRKGRLLKALCWLQLVAGFMAILLTASRGSLLAALAGLVMLPLSLSRLPGWHRLVALVACAGVLAGGAYLIPQSSWNRIFTLGEEVSKGTLTHRTALWAAGLEAFRDHAFLGVGAGAYGITISKAADFAYRTGSASNAVAHNTFLSVLVELGVVGALLLLALLASIFYCALRMAYLERRLWITLLLTWTIGVSALTWEYRKPTWLLFGLIAAHAFSRRRASRTQPVPETALANPHSIT